MTVLSPITGNTSAVADSDSTDIRELEDARARLRIIHDLSKHVWEDNQKRNFRLLRDIHKYSHD
jgi:hypothetical protein